MERLGINALALALTLAAGCTNHSQDQSAAAVHIDNLREQLNAAKKQITSLKYELTSTKTRLRAATETVDELQKNIVESPKITIGRFLAVQRRQKAGAAGERLPDVIRQMLSDFLLDARHGNDPITALQFDSFVDWMNKYDGDIPAGLVLKVDWGDSTELRDKYDDLIKFDQALNEAETDSQRYILYFEREMERLGKFADDIINPK